MGPDNYELVPMEIDDALPEHLILGGSDDLSALNVLQSTAVADNFLATIDWSTFDLKLLEDPKIEPSKCDCCPETLVRPLSNNACCNGESLDLEEVTKNFLQEHQQHEGTSKTDYNRHLETLVEKTEKLLTYCLKTKVSKENICQIAKYQALIERVRELSHDECESVTMTVATELFLERIDRLSKLLQEMKNFETPILTKLEKIEADLGKLKEFVEQDQCLNAGGKFEWVDSILVKCLQEGTWLLVDQVNLCSPAVLDRLNGLLEPNGVLSIGERGVDSEGNVVTVKPHENFRLFLTMDPKYGEISRAMRNRGVEIFMLNNNENREFGKLDYRSLLYDCGLTKRNHQEAFMTVHKRVCEDPSNIDNVNVIQLLHAGFLAVQQLSRGFPVSQAFKTSCTDVYLRARSIFHSETRLRLSAIVEDTIREFEVDEGDAYVLDLDAATCSVRSLQDNSKLTLIRQQGLLMHWCTEGYLWVKKNKLEDGEKITLKTDFINEFFADDNSSFISAEVLEILPYILLNFYEHSTPSDVDVQKLWAASLFKQHLNLEFLNNKNVSLAHEVLSFNFGRHDKKVPWNKTNFENANNLALLLYYVALVVDDEMENEWKIDKNEKMITVAQFSEAHREGKMTIKLKDQPLITNYVILLQQVKKCIDHVLRNSKKVIDGYKYVVLRQKLKWYSRYCDMGRIVLLNRAEKSKNLFENVDEVTLLMKVHYKWLTKFLDFLEENYEEHESDVDYIEHSVTLRNIMDEIDTSLISVYDPFRKICKVYKKRMNSPLPCSSDVALNACPILQSITDSFSPTRNKYISSNLSNERKFITLQTAEALQIRSQLISLWHNIYDNETIDESIFDTLKNMNKFCSVSLNVTESSEDSESTNEFEKLSPKDIAKLTSNVQLWPLHEYMFTLFVSMFQRKLCEKLSKDDVSTLPSAYLSNQHMHIPNIPVELLAILDTINRKQDNLEERNRLLFALFTWFLKFNENSYAIKNFKQVSHWRYMRLENSRKTTHIHEVSDRDNIANGPVLVSLISELLLDNLQQSRSDKSVLVTGVNLGSYNARLEQLKTINDILWKNSAAINSPEFSSVSNDLETLKCLLKNFVAVCDQVEIDLCLKNLLESEKLKSSSKSTISSEYLKPLEDLSNIEKSLSLEKTNFNRGKAWTLLGYLQAFVFGNMGYIDPVHKAALKLRYVEEDIRDCENTIYVATLYSRILGLADYHTLHPRVDEIEDNLKKLTDDKNSLQRLKAVRPVNTEFIALSKEFTNFRTALGSYAIVSKHVERLIETSIFLENEASQNNIESAKSAKREAEMWLESMRRFMDQVEARFLSGYPDIVLPILAGLAQMRHGVRILIDESGKRITLAETHYNAEKLRSFVCNLVRFPTVGPQQESLLNLVNLCTSHESRELLSFSLKSENTFIALQEQFRLTISGLYEFYNYVVLKGTLSNDLWIELNRLLKQIVLIWRQQQKEIEKREAEKDSLYKNRVKVHGDSLTEEEEIAQDLKNLFPTHREDDFADVDSNLLPSLEKKIIIENKEEDFSALITENDMKEVQNIHSNIIKSFTTSEWLCKNAIEDRADFIEPLLQRYNTFGLLLNNVAPALDNELTGKVYTSLNVLTQLVFRLGQGEKLNPESCIHAVKKDNKVYDYYRDSNVEEVRQCTPLIETVSNKVSELLKEWPEHPTLASIKIILQRIYSFPVTSAVSRFLTGLELLLVKMHEWEENAHSGVSLSEYILAVTQQIITWRKLELACWKDCLTTAHLKLRSHASKWWFFLYDLFDTFIVKDKAIEKSTEESITAKKLIESLETFINESTLVEFEARLELILTFHCHVYYLTSCTERDELLAISWNIYHYYRQFLPDINNRITSIKTPIEKKLKDFVKIARWNDISYWAVKETVEKTHRTLHKFIKEFETGLKELVTPYLIVKPTYKSEVGVWDRPTSDRHCSIDPNDYVIATLKTTITDIPSLKSDIIAKADSHYLIRAKKLCKETILTSVYPGLIISLESFIEDFVEHSAKLKNQEIDRTQPKPKQKSQAKQILQQKRLVLTDYFKTLTRYGVSHRVGTLAWKNRLEEVLDFSIPPVELKAALEAADTGVIKKRTLDQWDGCERYYYGSLIKLNALNRSLLSNKTDLGPQNIEWCKGFSTHLMLMANNQKKSLASVLKYVVSLNSQVSSLMKMNVDNFVITKQKELQLIANNLRELIITAQTIFEQFLIYMQACPTDVPIEDGDNAYNLAVNNLPIVDCKKGDNIWEKTNDYIKGSLNIITEISQRFNTVFPELHIVCRETVDNEIPTFILTSKHLTFLTESFNLMQNVKEKINQFSPLFNDTEDVKHPLLENIIFLEKNITDNLNKFEEVKASLEQQSNLGNIQDINNFENDLEKLTNIVLIVIQNKYKESVGPVENDKNDIRAKDTEHESETENENDDEYEQNKLREKLVESIETDIKTLKLKEIYEGFNGLLKTIITADCENIVNYSRLLQKCLPLLKQYLLLSNFYVHEQVASLRITCKLLNMQLNVFLDLANNGFCVPKDLDLEEGDEGSEEKTGQGGMGLGDGEGEKDVSDRIETEDQLDDAKPAGQEKEKPEDKECPEEDKGIEMSEDFEGALQDWEQKEDDEGDKDDDDNAEKQMGETNEGADKLDEEIWGDDDEEPESEETKKNEDEIGDGEDTGEKEFGAKDDRAPEDSNDKQKGDQDDDQEEKEKEQLKEINEMEEPEYDEDQVNPYHGKHQPEPEPEPLELPEEMNIDDDDDAKDDEQNNEENPFDIDKMKETMELPETKEETETGKDEEESKEDETAKNEDSSDEEEEDGKEKSGDKVEKEDEVNENENTEETDTKGPESSKENKEEAEEQPEEAEKELEETAMPSTDEASKEMDASEEVDQREGGSRDQAASSADVEDNAEEECKAENWQDEKQDKGTGQSQAEQHDAGHSGSSAEKASTVPNRENEIQQKEKRKKPGQTDEDHTLAEKIEPDKKKLRTMIHAQEKLADDDNNDEGAEPDEEGEPDICQHVKEKEKFDHYAMDAATEEQSKEQASNMEQEEEPPKDEEKMDVDMHEDEELEVIEDETTVKQNPEKLSEEEKAKDKKKDSKEKGRTEDGQIETTVDVEGENLETMRVSRGTESAFFTKVTEIEHELLSSRYIEQRRMEVEKMLSQWTHVPTTEEAVAAWNTLSAVTDAAARDLSEKLRLVLEPTQASRLKGDYRTGRRINMRKIIPYIASQFRKDKIWLRRTKPSKRDYQIVLAIDDSSSMADNHSKELAFESLSLISKAMTYLEAGQLAVLSFGEETSILHPLGETFSERSGSRLMQEMRFEQKKTMVGQLVDFTVDMLHNQSSSTDNAKLLVVLSDGRGVFSEGQEKVNRAVRRARLADIFLVFIIMDNPLNKDSILDIRMPVFQGGKLIGIHSYMDSFPFPFYMILRDINALPGVLSDALRQWFEVVGKIDS